MNVRELIQELQKMDPDRTVLLSKDEEGNGFGELHCVQKHKIYKDRRDYEVFPDSLKEFLDDGWDRDLFHTLDDAIILWP